MYRNKEEGVEALQYLGDAQAIFVTRKLWNEVEGHECGPQAFVQSMRCLCCGSRITIGPHPPIAPRLSYPTSPRARSSFLAST
ncbi:hypothetical protein M427DRAFT_60220 [Gonapodya prolifera JEL478]|uniref:Uncharacterized protein n=1 Tax=Gonapodya prolifera (strain JEL478) TaxID=1344416 RepID=A0A139A4M8_GONPJ|nr:hypothetical protein M427DRAFT_60220 [Gonapodya prolifera JEL478]|eukprot:KXS11772.1 hypothetical protein M427DRAFT_60220 [Gonapodya prolifera JEL478]